MQKACEKCDTEFGWYFCEKCRLYDDEDKGQFHCEGCGLCRFVSAFRSGPEVIKLFFKLSSAEHEILNAHKC